MSLVRLWSPLNKLIIRKFGDVGGASSDRVDAELDNIIAYVRTTPRTIHRDFTEVGNVNTGLDNLMGYTIPAATLEADGDYLVIHGAGNFAANDDNKRIQVTWNGTAFLDTGLADFDTFGWQIQWILARQSATTVASSMLLVAGKLTVDSGGAIASNGSDVRTAYVNAFAANNFGSNTNTLQFQGESATATNNNVTQNILTVQLVQQ